jgi:glycosyltransferase involved in cell wall biosynthesis
MTSFCVLLDGPVTNDGRVQRTVGTLSRIGDVLLVTSGGSEDDQALFRDRVEVKPTRRPEPAGLRRWVLLHRQNDQLVEAALSDGRPFDVVWANDYATLHPATRVAREADAKLVYDSHELWLETVNQFFPRDASFPKSLAFRAAIGISRAIGNREEPRLADEVDVVITANESYATILRDRFHRQVDVVLNCPEPAELRPSNRIREELELPETDRIVLYQGMMNAGRGLPELVQAARGFPERAQLVMLGGGVLEPALRRAVLETGLGDRVKLAGVVPQGQLHEWTASADLGVLVLEPINLSKKLALANKVFQYMAAAIPVLATDLPENRRIIEQCECGWLVSNTRSEALAEQIGTILGDPDEMRRRGENGRRWFEDRYNWSVESKHLIASLRKVLPETIEQVSP